MGLVSGLFSPVVGAGGNAERYAGASNVTPITPRLVVGIMSCRLFYPSTHGSRTKCHGKKIKVTQSWCIFISLLEDQSKCCFFTGEAISNISCKPAFTQTRRHWSFIFVITQAHRCINIISCKGQQVKPKATLSSFVCLLGFLLLMAAVTRAVGNANWH